MIPRPSENQINSKNTTNSSPSQKSIPKRTTHPLYKLPSLPCFLLPPSYHSSLIAIPKLPFGFSVSAMMHMTFYWGKSVTILFDSWRTASWTSYLLSLLALFLAAAFYQYLESVRIRFKRWTTTRNPKPVCSDVQAPLLTGPSRTWWVPSKLATAALFGFNSAVGYMLMLAIMSFNGGVFIAIIVGLAFGYLFFRSGGEEDIVAIENPCACA